MPKYFREVNKHFSGDKTLAAKYMGVARSLLGGLKEMSGKLFSNARQVTLPDGVTIRVSFAGAIHQVSIDVRGVARKITELIGFVTTPRDSSHPTGLATGAVKTYAHSTLNKTKGGLVYRLGEVNLRYFGSIAKPSYVTSIAGAHLPRLDDYDLPYEYIALGDNPHYVINSDDEFINQLCFNRDDIRQLNGVRSIGVLRSNGSSLQTIGSAYYINGLSYESPRSAPVYGVWVYNGTQIIVVVDNSTWFDAGGVTTGYAVSVPQTLSLYKKEPKKDVELVTTFALTDCSVHKTASPADTLTTQAVFKNMQISRDGKQAVIDYFAYFRLPDIGYVPVTTTATGLVDPSIATQVNGKVVVDVSTLINEDTGESTTQLAVSKRAYTFSNQTTNGALYSSVSLDPLIDVDLGDTAVTTAYGAYLPDGAVYTVPSSLIGTSFVVSRSINGVVSPYKTITFTATTATLDLRAHIVPESGAVIVSYFHNLIGGLQKIKVHVLFLAHDEVELIEESEAISGDSVSTRVILGDVSKISDTYLVALDVFYYTLHAAATQNRHLRINKLVSGASGVVKDITATGVVSDPGVAPSTYPFDAPDMVLWPSAIAVV
jgi:hypothetical protein